MGESPRYASADSLDMSWLPLSRFESRAACVAVSRRVRGSRVPHPISVGSIFLLAKIISLYIEKK